MVDLGERALHLPGRGNAEQRMGRRRIEKKFPPRLSPPDFSGYFSTMGRKVIDLTGREFGLLKVLRYAGMEKRHALWRCRCVCGVEVEVKATRLIEGTRKACDPVVHGGRAAVHVLLSPRSSGERSKATRIKAMLAAGEGDDGIAAAVGCRREYVAVVRHRMLRGT